MEIRKAVYEDLDSLEVLLKEQKQYLKNQDIPQWQGDYPCRDTFASDIEKGWLYVLCEENAVIGFFALIYPGNEYNYIENGSWKSRLPYASVHRMAVADSCKGKGYAKKIFDFIKEQYSHIRIDTHEKNISMQRAVLKSNFEYCGVIYLDSEHKEKRIAFEFCKKEKE